MKWYTCHKRVQAAEIVKIEPNPTNSGSIFTFDEGPTLELPFGDKMTSRYDPVVGDFLVQYEDGYRSFSPRKAFIDGYTLEGQSFREIKEGINK